MKAVIFGFLNFPRGDATANYVQYLGLALKQLGYEVHYVTNNPNTKERCSSRQYMGMNIHYYYLNKKKINHYIEYNYLRGLVYLKEIKKLDIKEDDVLISYCQDYFEYEPVLSYAKANNIKTVACITEYFPRDKYKTWLRAKFYYLALNKSLPRHDIIWPISTYIQGKYENNKSLVLPIMADTYEYDYKEKRYDGKIRIVYPANGKMKDALKPMLEAIMQLQKVEREKIELHLTSATRELISEYCIPDIDNVIGKNIIIHDWMQYDELIELYQNSHFLFLAREDNQMTQANFPSKVPEVMTYGVTPICTDVGDYTKYYLKDGIDSIIFEGCKVNDCIDGLRRAILLETSEVRNINSNSRKTAEMLFDYRNWVSKIQESLMGE